MIVLFLDSSVAIFSHCAHLRIFEGPIFMNPDMTINHRGNHNPILFVPPTVYTKLHNLETIEKERLHNTLIPNKMPKKKTNIFERD